MLPGWNVEVHAAAAAVLSRSFLFLIFFHLFRACQVAVQRFLEKETSCGCARVLKRRQDDIGIYRVQVRLDIFNSHITQLYTYLTLL